MTTVAVGSVTLTDVHDAKVMSAFVSASQNLQQAYAKDDSTPFSPDWSATPFQVLTASAFAGSATNVVSQLTNMRWSRDTAPADDGSNVLTSTSNFANTGTVASGSVYVVNGASLTIKANMPTDVPVTYYFAGDYTDVMTGAVTTVSAHVTLSRVTIGSNATWVQVSGQTTIKRSAVATKALTAVRATLIRSGGADLVGCTYKWYVAPYGAGDQIDATYDPGVLKADGVTPYAVTELFGLKTTSGEGAPTTPSVTDLGQNIPANGASTPHNTLVVHEDAVSGQAFFKVEVTDASPSAVQNGWFTLIDTSDPYTVTPVSSAGNVFKNGVGNTVVYPVLTYGGKIVTDTTGWKFNWVLYDRMGNLGAFVDLTRSGGKTGKRVSASSALSGSDVTITVEGWTADSGVNRVPANSPVKIFCNGFALYFKVKADVTSGSTITLTHTSTWPLTGQQLDGTVYSTNKFANCYLWFCRGLTSTALPAAITLSGGATGVGTVADPAGLAVTDADTDYQGVISVAAERP